MTRGRTPNAGKELQPVDDIQPTRPLTPWESDTWERWKGILRQIRQFLATDGPLLVMVVEFEWRKYQARLAIERDGAYPPGCKRRHPAFTDLDNAQRDQMAVLRELGLTPASMKNVRAEKRTPQTDDLDTFTNEAR